jgi:hypothetical protein
MCDDFLSLRAKFASAGFGMVAAFEWPGAAPSNCWGNVKQIVAQFGGSFAYGWAFDFYGPWTQTGRQIAPLYSRWVNHVVWRDSNGVLWEVTPHRNLFDPKDWTWASTCFLPDDEAQFTIVSDEIGKPQPSLYIALQREGEWTADCLSLAERAPRAMQDGWLARALYSLKVAGLVPTDSQVERDRDTITKISLIVE